MWIKSLAEHQTKRKNDGVDYANTLWNNGKTSMEILQMAETEHGAFAVGMKQQAAFLDNDTPPYRQPVQS